MISTWSRLFWELLLTKDPALSKSSITPTSSLKTSLKSTRNWRQDQPLILKIPNKKVPPSSTSVRVVIPSGWENSKSCSRRSTQRIIRSRPILLSMLPKISTSMEQEPRSRSKEKVTLHCMVLNFLQAMQIMVKTLAIRKSLTTDRWVKWPSQILWTKVLKTSRGRVQWAPQDS